MSREDIQTANPGGVSKRTTAREGIHAAVNLDSDVPTDGVRMLRRQQNL